LEQSLPADALAIPWLLEFRGDALLYAYSSPEAVRLGPRPELTPADRRDPQRMRALGHSFVKRPSPRLLDEFVGLADASNEQIFAFAQRWGVLDLCKHDLPMTHVVEQIGWDVPKLGSCELVKIHDPRLPGWSHHGLETMRAWRMWARRARALMRIAATLKGPRRSQSRDWSNAPEWEGLDLYHPFPGDSDDVVWRMLCEFVDRWCDLVQLRPHLVYRGGDELAIQLGSKWGLGRLFGTIGLQMMVRISAIGSIAFCSYCGSAFKPERIPNPSRLRYCESCRKKGIPVLTAKRRLTERKLKARELLALGHSSSEIARLVGSRESTVKALLRKEGRRKK
jgi:hypothetical protein